MQAIPAGGSIVFIAYYESRSRMTSCHFHLVVHQQRKSIKLCPETGVRPGDKKSRELHSRLCKLRNLTGYSIRGYYKFLSSVSLPQDKDGILSQGPEHGRKNTHGQHSGSSNC
jgi:hypothetical protein